jgi:hypothetical protein
MGDEWTVGLLGQILPQQSFSEEAMKFLRCQLRM